MARFVCVVCEGREDKQPDCEACAGSGMVRNVPFADRPFDQIAKWNLDGHGELWLGGHDWAGPEATWAGDEVTTEMLADANFDVVISFYRRFGRSEPALHVEHHHFRMPDGALDDMALLRVRELADLAVTRMKAGKKVLIRCQAGLNRSSLCTGYALIQMGMEPQQAIDHIRSLRSPYALCNGDFVTYLHAMAEVSQ